MQKSKIFYKNYSAQFDNRKSRNLVTVKWVSHFMMITVLRCWWLFRCNKSVSNIWKLSPTPFVSNICHQDLVHPVTIFTANIVNCHQNQKIDTRPSPTSLIVDITQDLIFMPIVVLWNIYNLFHIATVEYWVFG